MVITVPGGPRGSGYRG